jgi:hypothetical protein
MMSCDTSGRRVGDAAKRNGIGEQVSRYLNTIGSWSTYRDLGSAEEIPERLAQVTAAFFGVKGLINGHPRLAGVLGVIIGVHALEQVTGGIATTAMRLYGRGRPLVNYRGILVRQSPFTPKAAGLFNRLTGGRVLEAKGYYFFESGRTWHCQSTTVQVGDLPKTLTRVQSYSIPHREFYFDRPVLVPETDGQPPVAGQRVTPIQRVIDTVLGNDNADSIPGFIGSVNELEDASGMVGQVKRLFFLSNWLLMDEGERDGGRAVVDYEALVKGTPPGGAPSGGGIYQVSRSTSSGSSSFQSPVRTIPAYPSISYTPPPPPPPPPHEAALFTRPPSALSIQERYRDRLRIGSKDYPLVVKRVVLSPFSGGRKADAIYYDEEVGSWRVVDDEADRINLAQAVDEGRISITPAADWPA